MRKVLHTKKCALLKKIPFSFWSHCAFTFSWKPRVGKITRLKASFFMHFVKRIGPLFIIVYSACIPIRVNFSWCENVPGTWAVDSNGTSDHQCRHKGNFNHFFHPSNSGAITVIIIRRIRSLGGTFFHVRRCETTYKDGERVTLVS